MNRRKQPRCGCACQATASIRGALNGGDREVLPNFAGALVLLDISQSGALSVSSECAEPVMHHTPPRPLPDIWQRLFGKTRFTQAFHQEFKVSRVLVGQDAPSVL